jgi:DNA-binding MarR family transcriptional regulator
VNPVDFIGALDRLSRLYHRARKAATGVTGLTEDELAVLSEAGRKPGSAVDQIAEALSMTANAAAGIVGKLLKKGFLSGSEKAVEPTPKGLEATDQVWLAFAQALGGAASIATAIAGLITTIASILDRWTERPAEQKQATKRRKRSK